MACADEGKESIYYGETSRTLRERISEHQDKRGSEESHMTSHEIHEHEGDMVVFQPKVI